MMSCCHDIGEGKQGWHPSIIFATRQDDERAICLGNPNRFGLGATRGMVSMEETTVNT